ncbi:Sec1-like family protein [Cavenderia fasciculata]|uniref:Sec1-like family protein n=1 Tax=Cavenderia fasciculata TaxID=261658 RepID=F4PGZ1_CACFS|nr:Sec1-like family protein [Cavenderia fasciculata]EGG24975.1 Sec1-like family protein [Cavenderia fasciculata]|eukprot:XP_004362826.1 Sec1-like family protein [Cavenderia fasciculata]
MNRGGPPPQQQQARGPQPGAMGKVPAQPTPAGAKKPPPLLLSQIPNISGQVLNLSSIRDQSKRELGEALDILPGGNKALVMDPKIIGLLNLVVDPQFLQSHGAERNYELKNGRLDTNCKNIIYIIRPKIKYMQMIKEHIIQHDIEKQSKRYAIIYIPRRTILCDRVLEEEGVAGNEFFNIKNNAVYLDEDLVNPPQGSGAPGQPAAPPPAAPGAAGAGGKKLPFPLHSNDKVFAEIRDTNFSVLGGILHKKAKDIDEYYKRFQSSQSPAAIRDFVKKLAQYQQEHNSLRIHTNVTEKILDITKSPGFMRRIECEQNMLAHINNEAVERYLEECINKKDPMYKILRLLVIYSLTNGGFKPKQLEFYRREIVQSYGAEAIMTLNNFEKLGLLCRAKESKPTYPLIKQDLNLIIEDLDETNQTDIAYVYSGYAPLSVRLVQAATKPGGWRSIEQALRLLPGPTFEEVQPLPQGAQSNAKSDRKPITLVYFIGGVTFAEISALRFLGRQEQANRDFVIITTKLINGDSFVDGIVEKFGEE